MIAGNSGRWIKWNSIKRCQLTTYTRWFYISCGLGYPRLWTTPDLVLFLSDTPGYSELQQASLSIFRGFCSLYGQHSKTFAAKKKIASILSHPFMMMFWKRLENFSNPLCVSGHRCLSKQMFAMPAPHFSIIKNLHSLSLVKLMRSAKPNRVYRGAMKQ